MVRSANPFKMQFADRDSLRSKFAGLADPTFSATLSRHPFQGD
jgi:hypothetical protein